ncbi:hypothetical protein B0H13DRAFT_106138 [Mycena leptocephala]|nr:hypothetical protein B0H13DRAFT_106138 [Mycena leptocephala]
MRSTTAGPELRTQPRPQRPRGQRRVCRPKLPRPNTPLQRCDESVGAAAGRGRGSTCSPTARPELRAPGKRGAVVCFRHRYIVAAILCVSPSRMSFCPRSALGARQQGARVRARGVWQHFRVPQSGRQAYSRPRGLAQRPRPLHARLLCMYRTETRARSSLVSHQPMHIDPWTRRCPRPSFSSHAPHQRITQRCSSPIEMRRQR